VVVDGHALDIGGFQRWAMGDLAGNRNRGIFAEWLVAQALGVIRDGDVRQEWEAVDLRFGDLAVEVKASGSSQTWSGGGSSTPRFRIPRQKHAWFADMDEMIPYDPPRRTADVYVFCLHQSVPVTNENVADPRCWSFWVVATSAIDEELEGQASVGISTLNQLAEPIGWSDVKAAVERVAATAKARDGR